MSQIVNLKEATAILQKGGLLIYPTETALALGCAAVNEAAIKKIYAIKQRDGAKCLPLLAANEKQASLAANLKHLPPGLAPRFWPGPLTIILSANPLLPDILKNDKGKIALRITSSKIAASLANAIGCPLISTSANISGQPAPFSARNLGQSLLDACENSGMQWGILAGEEIPAKPRPSTIIEPFLKNGRWAIKAHRAGAIDIDQLYDANWDII